MTAHLVVGGTRSGKSGVAERLAGALGRPVVVVATGQAHDEEMHERIAAHQAGRPASWTVAGTTEVGAALDDVVSGGAALVDDLDGWVVAAMSAHRLWTDADVEPLGVAGRAAVDAIVADAVDWWRRATRDGVDLVVVAGQPGGGIVPLGAASRRYVDVHGAVTAALSEVADQVTLVVAGRPLPLPDHGPASDTLRVAAPSTTSTFDAGAPVAISRDHGDRQVPTGTLDLAVNVLCGPPRWLRDRLAAELDDLAAYPDDHDARTALAARHHRDPTEILPLAGAAEAMWLLPSVLRPRLAACVHPGFTEPEAALRAHDVPVVRVPRDPGGWTLDPDVVPDAADLVVVGRPDNPTGVVDPEPTIAALCRPGRTVVVDEAFAELLPDADGLAGRRDLPGLVVLRSLTKAWGLAGLRVGYLVGDADVVARCRARRQPWAVDALALRAAVLLSDAEDERRERAAAVARDRTHLVAGLRTVADLTVWEGAANYVLLHTPRPDLRDRLLAHGLAVRRGETFPGLDAHHVRVAVRPPTVSDQLVAALHHILGARS